MSLINTRVPPFKANAVVNRSGNGEFIEVIEQSLTYMGVKPVQPQQVTQPGALLAMRMIDDRAIEED